jgi:hypothetical protein
MQKQIVVILMLFSLAIVALLSTNSGSQASLVQFSTPEAVEFVQLQPFTTLAPGESAYVKVGTIGTSELMPCIAATRVWNTNLNAQLNIHSYCRIQTDGYAAVSFTNKGQSAVAVYDRVRVVVQK